MVKPFSPVASKARTRASLEAEFTRAVTTRGLSALVGREWEALFPRFARYYQQLTRLPRRTRRALQRQWKRSLGALALLLALGQAPALADILPVTTTVPDIASDAQCSLIEAIDNANDTVTGSVHTDCTAGDPAGADTIVLVAGSTHTLTVVDNGDTGLPVIASAITIEGNGSTIARGGGAPSFRIFALNDTGNLTLNETTVSGGGGDFNSGGGVYSRLGTVTLTNSTVSGNSAGSRDGGGVYSYAGRVTLSNSTVSGNSAGGAGGGVYLKSSAATLTNSTVSGNSAGSQGGGVSNNVAGDVPLTNSTVSGNSAGSQGGGVSNNSSDVILTNSTVSGNSAPTGAEVRSTVSIVTNITADNFNLFGHSALTNAQAFYGFTPGATDINATSDGTNTPLAGILNTTLASNGGPTQTHALVADSPAIDASPVDVSCEPADQRGVTRPQDGNGDNTPLCDIGAFELVPSPPPPPPPPMPTPPPVLCNGLPATIVGDSNGNRIFGTPGNDVIHGLAGNDTIAGLGGNDVICGGQGRDSLSGNSGNDKLFGNAGRDRLFGQGGRDRMDGQSGNDSCDGGNGTDRATRCEGTTRVP